MIQVIYDDGSKRRFTKKIIPVKGKKIIAQKVLTKAEEFMVPTLVDGKIVMISPTPYAFSNEEKWKKIDEIRKVLICQQGWIINVYTAQEHGHKKNINKKEKIMNEELLDLWCIWFEDMTYLKDSLDLDNINYEEIKEENTDIFPIMPEFPGDEKVKKKVKK